MAGDSSKSGTDFPAHCRAALAAFNLRPATDAEASASDLTRVTILKDDDFSTVWQLLIAPAEQNENSGNLFFGALKHHRRWHSPYPHALVAAVESRFEFQAGEADELLLPPRIYTLADEAECFDPGDPEQQSFWTLTLFIENTPTFDWLDDPAGWNSAQAASAGALLARFHRHSQRATADLSEEEKTALQSRLPGLEEALHQSLSIHHQDLWQALTGEGERAKIKETVRSAIAAARACGGEIIVHGDFHPGNILFEGEEAIALLDLDYARLEHPDYDLAYATLTFGGEFARELRNSYSRASDRSVDPSRLAAFQRVAAADILLWCLAARQSEQTNERLKTAIAKKTQEMIAFLQTNETI